MKKTLQSIQSAVHSGDTIVEVILAMALLTMMLFIAWGSTNRSSQQSLNARKRITMVNELKQQAEIIRNQRDYPLLPSTFSDTFVPLNLSSAIASNPCDDVPGGSTTPPANSFYFNESGKQPGYKKVSGDVNSKVWVQVKTNGILNPKYLDFYVSGCWVTVGNVQNTDSSQILMRLNL